MVFIQGFLENKAFGRLCSEFKVELLLQAREVELKLQEGLLQMGLGRSQRHHPLGGHPELGGLGSSGGRTVCLGHAIHSDVPGRLGPLRQHLWWPLEFHAQAGSVTRWRLRFSWQPASSGFAERADAPDRLSATLSKSLAGGPCLPFAERCRPSRTGLGAAPDFAGTCGSASRSLRSPPESVSVGG